MCMTTCLVVAKKEPGCFYTQSTVKVQCSEGCQQRFKLGLQAGLKQQEILKREYTIHHVACLIATDVTLID
jgi:hypothetical protein